MKKLISVVDISKKFGQHVVFEHFSCEIYQNEFVAIIGKSGSGKSTLLNMLGLLDKPDSGMIEIFGKKNVSPLSKEARKLLKWKIGYLFQNFALVENKTVFYNLMLCIEHFKMDDKKKKILDALCKVDLKGCENKKIYECSGGEQQRIALARLLVKPCELILADEPTGSLDAENKKIVIDILKEFQKSGKTIVMVSHDLELVNVADRLVHLT